MMIKLYKLYFKVLNNDSLERIEVDETIVSVSLGVLKKHHTTLFEPTLPEKKISAIEEMGFGLVNKIFLHYSNPFWSMESGGVQFLHKTQQGKAFYLVFFSSYNFSYPYILLPIGTHLL